MNDVITHDYVVTFISDSYLKSENCMFEINKWLKNKDYKAKTL